MAWPLKPPLTVFAATVAAKVAALAGNSPSTSCEVGATCTACAVLAEVYQDTTRCDALAPTPRTMPVTSPAPAAPAVVIEPMPNAAETARAARPAATAAGGDHAAEAVRGRFHRRSVPFRR